MQHGLYKHRAARRSEQTVQTAAAARPTESTASANLCTSPPVPGPTDKTGHKHPGRMQCMVPSGVWRTKNTRRWSEPQTTFLSELTAQPAVKLGLLTPQGPHNRANWISAKVAATAGGRTEAQASTRSRKGLRAATCRRLAFLDKPPSSQTETLSSSMIPRK